VGRHSRTAVAPLIAIFGEGLSVDYNKITPRTIIIYALRERIMEYGSRNDSDRIGRCLTNSAHRNILFSCQRL
jgi:hypothetical protein